MLLDAATLSHRNVYNRLQHPIGAGLPMGQRDGVIAPGFLRGVANSSVMSTTSAMLIKGIVERLGVMLQHVELRGLFLPFCHARNGNGDFRPLV